MAEVKKAVKSKAKSGLGAKAQAKGSLGGGATQPNGMPDPAEHDTMPQATQVFNQSPPPPPALMYVRYFSQIPSLRKNKQTGM